MDLEKLSPEQIVKVEVPTGSPKVYELDENLRVKSTEYLQ
jgi:2,3-bisphosphoglycerate-dependent phosphoglycerate mutase